MEHFDAVIIGAGQGGGPLAVAFARAGRRVALVERAHIGGTCINDGCSPTKTMIASARVAHLARRAADYGVQTGPVRVDLARVRDRKRAIVESFRGGSERALTQAGVNVIRGAARFIGATNVAVTGSSGERRLTAPLIFINVGLRPARLSVPGLDAASPLDSTSIMELDRVPRRLVVLGAGYVGLEFAQMFRRFGAEVMVVTLDDVRILRARDAREHGHRVRVATLPMSSVARAIETDERRGFLQAVVDADSGRILGAAVLGTEGGELATLFQVAMLGKLPYTVLRDGIFSHPGFAESLNNLFTAMDRAAA